MKGQHQVDIDIDEMKKAIAEHIMQNSSAYQQFYRGDPNKMLDDLFCYFEDGGWNRDVCDLLPHVIAIALQLNIQIYTYGAHGAVRSQMEKSDSPDASSISLFFHSNHYDAVLPHDALTDEEDTFDDTFEATSYAETLSCTPSSIDNESLTLTPSSPAPSPAPSTAPSPSSSFLSFESEDGMDNEHLKKYFSSGKSFPFHLFKCVPTMSVDKVPLDLNGTSVFSVHCESQDWNDKAQDHWHFNMVTCRVKGFDGKRKLGKCLGNFSCTNKDCPKVLCDAEGRPNRTNFNFSGGKRYCFSCGFEVTQRQECGARKLMVYENTTELLMVYHLERHVCLPKNKGNDRFISEMVAQDKYGLKAKQLQKQVIKEGLLSRDPSVARHLARKMVDRTRIQEVQSRTRKEVADPNSLEAVCVLRAKVKTLGPYYVYQLNDSRSNSDPDFVFMGSEVMSHVHWCFGERKAVQ